MPDTSEPAPQSYSVHYTTVALGGLDIFYRQAGPKEAPVILLLHGFPASSNMFRNLITRLAGPYRVIAPDYPGYGFSSAPRNTDYAYTFDNCSEVVGSLVQHLQLTRYPLYVMDPFRSPASH